jgi:hypothetical protein
LAADDRHPGIAGTSPRRTVVLAGVLGAAVAVAVLVATLSSSSSGHEAVAEVTVGRPDLDDGSRDLPDDAHERRMATEVYYAESPSVAELVRAQLGADHEQITGIDAEAVEDDDVVRFTVSATSPEIARRGADGYAEAYVQQRRQQFQAAFTHQIEDLEAQIEGGLARLEAIADSLATTDDQELVQSLAFERDVLSSNLDRQLAQVLELRDRLERLEANVRVRTGAG